MDLGLHGKVVLITGGSDGLGAATAARVVEEGAAVAICARGQERLAATADRLRGLGGDVLAVPTDVTEPEQVDAFVAAAYDRWGRIDGLVNNAGVHAGAPFESVTDEAWHADLDLKLMAALRATRAAMPHLRAHGGSVVNVLAISAKAPGPGSMPSSVSRAAGMAFRKALSKEVGVDGVRANAVLVGILESDQWVRAAAGRGVPVEQVHQEMATALNIPLGRVGRSEEFADVTAFLLSERSSYVSGAAINVEGGLSGAV
ncbi:SDR family oxidoreductase [soil metagenome]